MRSLKLLLGAVMLGGVLFGTTAAFGATAPTGGAIQVWVTPSPTGNGGGTVLISGALADYGTAQKVTASGKPDANGDYRKVTLKNGTLLVNLTKFTAASNNAKPAMYNTSDCSAVVDFSAPAAIMDGTGAYAGITGVVNFSAKYVFLLAKTKKGTCNENANPLDVYASVQGTSTVKFG